MLRIPGRFLPIHVCAVFPLLFLWTTEVRRQRTKGDGSRHIVCALYLATASGHFDFPCQMLSCFYFVINAALLSVTYAGMHMYWW